MTSGCGCLLWLLVLLVGVCRLGFAKRLNNEIEMRSTRRLCGHAFDKMYFIDACDMLGKRSAWPALWPSKPQLQLVDLTSGTDSVWPDSMRPDSVRLNAVSPDSEWPERVSRLHNSLLHRLSRSVRSGRQLWSADYLTDLTPASPRHPVWQTMRTSKRSAETYRSLHNECCDEGCTAARFRGIC